MQRIILLWSARGMRRAWRTISAPQMGSWIELQDKAWKGGAGGYLCVSSADGGKLLNQIKLHSPPVLDGMAAAYQQLYLVTKNGAVICLE